jgi:prevent-host-death family protein
VLMKTVGLRQLKNQLSSYVRRAQKGEALAVTDRGEIVAELVPPRHARDALSGLAELARAGELTPALPASRRKRAALFAEMPRALTSHTAAELLEAERGER